MLRAWSEKLFGSEAAWLLSLREHIGLVYLIGAQASLVLFGYVTNVFVARSLGPSATGRFGVVLSVLVWVEVLIIDGAPQALRRYIALEPAAAGTIVRSTWKVQLGLVGAVFVAAFGSASVLSALFRDPSYTLLFRIAFVDILLYGVYWYVNGILHGLKAFHQLFWMISGYAVGKCLLTVGLIIAGLGVPGALAANALASLVGVAIGLRFVAKTTLGHRIWNQARAFWDFSRWNIVYGLLTSLLPTLDLWCVRYFGTDHQAGIYSVAASVARIPYFLAIAFVSFALPSLASNLSNSTEGSAGFRRSWRTTLTAAFGMFLPLLVAVEVLAKPLVVLIFGREYLDSAILLQILFPGTILYSLFLLENTRAMAIHGMAGPIRIVIPVTVMTVIAVALGAMRHGPIGAAMGFGVSMAVAYLLSRAYGQLPR